MSLADEGEFDEVLDLYEDIENDNLVFKEENVAERCCAINTFCANVQFETIKIRN